MEHRRNARNSEPPEGLTLGWLSNARDRVRLSPLSLGGQRLISPSSGKPLVYTVPAGTLARLRLESLNLANHL
jgi:hypothetical protein